MRKIYSLFFCLAFCVVGGDCTAQDGTFTMETILPNNSLIRAWDIDYGPDGWLWISERTTGRMIRINPETKARDVLTQVTGTFSDSSQDGLLGFALHGDFQGGSPFVYLSYTYLQANERRQALARYTYSENNGDGSLTDRQVILDGLPGSNDHNSGRLVFGPDQKLYYTIGDQGGNQNRNYCEPILSQNLPTQAEVDGQDWSNYPGKTLRLELDGGIPADNPEFGGIRSHVYTVGHRNAQGIDFGSNGRLYSSEHGPDTDDEVNIIASGQNYGWPRVVGFQDDQAYDYCNWSSLSNCGDLDYNKLQCPTGATFLEESTFTDPDYAEPLFSMFAVTDDYDFNDPRCESSYTCRPNVAPSSIMVYENDGIPEWGTSLLVTSLKRGRVYRLQLDAAGTGVVGDTTQLWYSANRYRDITMAPDGKTFYLLTDQSGPVTDRSGLNRLSSLRNPGTIMKVVFEGSTSVSGTLTPGALKVFPNPATDVLNLELAGNAALLSSVTVLNATGAIQQTWSAINKRSTSLPIHDLSAGVYFIRVMTDRGTATRRVIVR